MLLFSPHITGRLRYIVRFFSQELFSQRVRLTSDLDEFERYQGPRINYSALEIKDSFSLRPVSLLFETGIRPIDITCFEWYGHPAFFPTEGDFPFDILAASFYLISRYEEYLPHEKDEYGRYAHTNSLAWRAGFLDSPLVNNWLMEFKGILLQRYPDLVFRFGAFTFIPTYDIDVAWSYLHKGWWRSLGGMGKALAGGHWKRVVGRVRVLQGRRPDPFDVYEWLDSLHLCCRLRPYYFFLAAARYKGVDRNSSPSDPALSELISYHAGGYRVGIHPSWQSGDEEVLLKDELEWMEAVTGQKIIRSRQHYIRFHLPEGYRRLLRRGIREEFSMGYGTINGFRASVASSFNWYDLGREEETELRVFPFCFMDANSFYEQGYNSRQAMTELLHYYRLIRKVNGLMITIWHNPFLGTDPLYAGWREVYETFLKEEVYWDM